MVKNTSFSLDEDATLRRALIAGEQSGESTPFDFDEFVSRKRTEEFRAELQ